jgi:hypothetical protein
MARQKGDTSIGWHEHDAGSRFVELKILSWPEANRNGSVRDHSAGPTMRLDELSDQIDRPGRFLWADKTGRI